MSRTPVVLIVVALAYVVALLVPLAAVFIEAFRKGVAYYLSRSAIPTHCPRSGLRSSLPRSACR